MLTLLFSLISLHQLSKRNDQLFPSRLRVPLRKNRDQSVNLALVEQLDSTPGNVPLQDLEQVR